MRKFRNAYNNNEIETVAARQRTGEMAWERVG